MKLKTNEFDKTPTQMVQKSHKAQIDKSAANLVMDMLSKIYAEPLAAAIREYVSNGIDSHTKANQTKAVDVHLPSNINPVLRVTDYGAGLSFFDILTIYANFGTSDKRDSDEFIGGFGIGSKSGLAVSDTILIKSVKDKVYNKFVLERTPDGIVTRFLVENQDTDKPNGTTVEIQVKSSYLSLDNAASRSTFVNTLAGWSKTQVNASIDDSMVAQLINDNRVPDTWTELDAGYITNDTLSKKDCLVRGALVGDVLYQDITSLISELVNQGQQKYEILHSQPFIVKLDIAKTRVSYSREKLLYRDDINTKNHIISQLEKLVDEIHKRIDNIKNLNLSAGEYLKRITAAGISTQDLKEYGKSLIYQTSQFDLRKDIHIRHRYMQFRGRQFSNFTLNTSDMASSIKTMLKEGCLLLTDKPTDIDNMSKRIVSDAVRAAINTDAPTPAMNEFRTYVDKEYYPKVYFMTYADAKMLPMAHRMIQLDFAELQKTRKEVNKAARQSNKSRSLYSYGSSNNTSLVEMESSYTLEEQLSTLLIPPTSNFVFNTQNNHGGLSILRDFTDFKTFMTTRTQRDFAELQNRMPAATILTDDEIVATIQIAIRPYLWVAEDWTAHMLMEMDKSMGTNEPQNGHVDFYKELDLIFKSSNVPYHLKPQQIKYTKRTLEGLKKGTDAKLQPMFANIDLDAHNSMPHNVDMTIKTVHLIAQNYNNRMFDEIELKVMLHDVRNNFAYQINMLNTLYGQYV